MRDLVVLAIILGAAPICFFRPYVGVLMWSWIAYFNPHRFTWGIAYDFPVAMVIAVPTLAGTLMSRDMNRRFLTRETFLLALIWIWFGVTLVYATQVPALTDHTDTAQVKLWFVSKILLMTFLSVLLVTSREKLKYLFLVTSLSFGVLVVKGTAFGLLTGGAFRVWGPPDSFIADNNAFGLAVNMALPMLFFLAAEEKNRKLQLILRACFWCGILSVVLTYSRGALLGLAAVLAAIAIKSRKKLLGIALCLVAGLVILTFAPQQWVTRMETFLGGKLDESAQQRLVSWGFAWNLARDYPITGGSFDTFTPALFQQYAPGPLPGGNTSSGPHSIYFQWLAEQGFVGLGLFLLLLASCWMTLRKLRRQARLLPNAEWMVSYTNMMEVSLLAFMVSGAFLEFGYFDLFFQLVATVAILGILCRRELALSTQTKTREKSSPVVSVQEAVS